MSLRVLIVDDEAPARRKLRHLLSSEDDLEVVGEAVDGEEAVTAILEQNPDVVLLDVQMPRKNGFEVIEAVGVAAMPVVVFITAFDEHALAAFDVEAVDYLLKPFAQRRLARALARARSRSTARRGSTTGPDAPESSAGGSSAGESSTGESSTGESSHGESESSAQSAQLAALLERLAERERPAFLSRLLVEASPNRQILVEIGSIDLLRARGNYVDLVTAAAEVHRCRGPLAKLEARLDPEQFLRINRFEIVRLAAVAEMQPWFHGDYRVVMNSGEVLSWSRRFRARRKKDFQPTGS